MAKLLVVIFPSDKWRFSRVFEMDFMPRVGEFIHCGDDCFAKVDMVGCNLLENLAEIEAECRDMTQVAHWFMKIPGWKIWNEEGFRKDEAEIRRRILEMYDVDNFIPVFERKEG